jgi:hydroxypyruvate reductase
MNRFDPAWLSNSPCRRWKSQLEAILGAALDAVDPVNAIKAQLAREDNALRVGDRVYNLQDYRRIFVVGAGKASAGMAQAVEQVLGERVTAGTVNVKYGYVAPTRYITLHQAGHPLPDENGVTGTRRMADLLGDAGADDLVICLISGGGSALMTLPVEGVTLADLKALTDALLRCGATINEINAVRKHLDQVKGGGLARLADPAPVIALLLSDVVGSPLDVIASGPTVPDTSTFADACSVLEKYGIEAVVPPVIADRLRRGRDGELPDTPKAGDPLFDKTQTLVVASNEVAAQAAINRAQALGFNTLLLSTFVEGEAREVARVLAGVAREIAHSGQPIARPACVVAGGETTVTIRGQGKGGRNQELALAAALAIQGVPDVAVVTLATDGSDGPTDAAGGLADGTTVQRGRALGLEAAHYLRNNDAYPFLAAVGDLLITGPTNTNVNDLTFVFAF